jgi:hypothetical protein
MAKSAKEMEAAIVANLAAKTGKDLETWVAALKTEAPPTRKAALSFLKREGLGHFQAMIVAKQRFPVKS